MTLQQLAEIVSCPAIAKDLRSQMHTSAILSAFWNTRAADGKTHPIKTETMNHGYSMLGFIVIVILYIAIGLMAAAGAIFMARKILPPRQSRSSMRCSSS